MATEIKCAAQDCMWNKAGRCGHPNVEIDAGAKCETYEPREEGGPAGGMPMMGMMGAQVDRPAGMPPRQAPRVPTPPRMG